MPRTYFNDYPGLTTTAAPAGALPGLAPTEGSGTPYGQVPSVPSPGTTSLDALLANINNLGNIGQLGAGLTAQGSLNAMQPYTAALPGLSGAYTQGMGNIQSLLKGQVPADVITQLQQQAAQRGVATGQGPGSPNTNAAYLRALGLTSLGLQDQGLTNLRGIMSSVPTGPQFNPQSMLLSPEGQQGWQYLANVLRAAPSPGQAATANLNALNRGLGTGYGAGGGTSQLQSFLNSMDQWAKQGWAQSEYGQPTPTWQQTHPGMTPGFPNPPGLPEPYDTTVDEYGYDPMYGTWVGTPDMFTPSGTDYGTTTGGMTFDPYSLEPIGDFGGGDYGMY